MNKRVKLPKVALEFFRENGRIGGHRRAANLSAEERSEQARKAVRARWAKRAAQSSKKKGTK
jgi:nanoRNase/pAp phosphatase (c-di-AMP/oligoRNAs hydrolase)